MKRCKSDELQQQQGEEHGAGLEDAVCHLPGADLRPGEAAGAHSAGGPTSDAGAAGAPNPGPRSKPPDLKKIQQLSEGSMFGHGLKHLFHSRRRSREREHQASQDSQPQPQPQGVSDHDSPDEKERSPEMHRVSYAMSLHDLPARPTAFNRVLQQIRSRPSIKRGASLHGGGGGGGGGSRRAKGGALELQRGSPHLLRKAPQDSGLAAILHQHQCRPRSSSTTDAALLVADGGNVYLLAEEAEGVADKMFRVGTDHVRDSGVGSSGVPGGQGRPRGPEPSWRPQPWRRRRPHQPGRARWGPGPPAHQGRHRPPAPEDSEDHGADQDRAGGAGRQRGRVPEVGQQRRQAAGVADQAGVREEEPEVGPDHRPAAQEAGALRPAPAGDRAERAVPAAQGRPARHAAGAEGRGRQRARGHQRLRGRRGGGRQGQPVGAVAGHPHGRGVQAPGVRQPDPQQVRQRGQHRPPEGPAGGRAPRRGRPGAERQCHARVQPQVRQRRRGLQRQRQLRRGGQQLRGRARRGPGQPQVQHAVRGPRKPGRAAGGTAGDQGGTGPPGGLHGGPEGPAAAGLRLHDPVPAGGALQVRAAGGAAQRPDRAAPERDDQPEAGAGQHGGEGGVPVLREGSGHPGGRGVLPDPGHQAGAAAAAAAGGAAGGRGERQRAGAAGQVHQRDPGADGRAAGVRVHHRQLHHAAHEDAPAHHQHRPPAPRPLPRLEALGRPHLPPGARAAAQLSGRACPGRRGGPGTPGSLGLLHVSGVASCPACPFQQPPPPLWLLTPSPCWPEGSLKAGTGWWQQGHPWPNGAEEDTGTDCYDRFQLHRHVSPLTWRLPVRKAWGE